MPNYDALLLVSFGGPESRGEVIPFLENVTRGRGVPQARLEQVAEHYYAFGGVSPINQQCRDLVAAIEKDFAASGVGLPVYWGNRNWDPYLADTVAAMAADGVRSALAFVTSAYSSFSSCRQYLDDIARARAQVGDGAPRIDKLRPYFNHPGFIEPLADATAAAVESLPAAVRDQADLVFTAHSIPAAMAAASGPGGGAYPAQLTEAAGLVRRAGRGAVLAAGLSEPERPAVPAVARPRRPRLHQRAGLVRVAGRGAGTGRLRLRPSGGQVRPGRRGGPGGGAAWRRTGPGGDSGPRSPFRRHGHRAGRRAAGRIAAARAGPFLARGGILRPRLLRLRASCCRPRSGLNG